MKHYDTIELTPAEEREWEVCKALLLTATPAFAELFYNLLSFGEKRAIFTSAVPIAATDGTALFFNPPAFFPLDPGERLFAMGHEILHCIFRHPEMMFEFQRIGHISYPDGVQLPYIHDLGNVAADFVVNAIQVEGKIGRINPRWYYDRHIATSADSFVDTYRKLFDRVPKIKVGGVLGLDPNNKPGSGQTGFDEHLDPGTAKQDAPEQAIAESSTPRRERMIAHALDVARRQGALPASLERALSKELEPQVDWRERLATCVSRRIGNDRWSFELPNQEWLARDIYVPSRSGFGAADIVVGGDTSGSISDEEVSMMFAELTGIMEQLRPKRIHAVWCDAAVHRVDVLSEPGDLALIKPPPGGGGTSFIPVFEWIEKQPDLELDGLIYITDGLGRHIAQAPNYPVIWGCVLEPGQVTFPFGDVIHIPRKGTARNPRR